MSQKTGANAGAKRLRCNSRKIVYINPLPVGTDPLLGVNPNRTERHNMQIPAVRIQMTGRVIANFALQHLKAAIMFRDHLIKLETDYAGQAFGSFFEEIRSYGSACIMSATASLEALINELFIAHNSPLRTQLPDFESNVLGQRWN